MGPLVESLNAAWLYLASYFLFYPLYWLLAAYAGLMVFAVPAAHALAALMRHRWSISKCAHRALAAGFVIHFVLLLLYGADAVVLAWGTEPFRYGETITPPLRALPYIVLLLIDIWGVYKFFTADPGVMGQPAPDEF